MLLAHRLRGDEPVADFRRERGNDAIDRPPVALEALPSFSDDHVLTLLCTKVAATAKVVKWAGGADEGAPETGCEC